MQKIVRERERPLNEIVKRNILSKYKKMLSKTDTIIARLNRYKIYEELEKNKTN